MEKTYLIYKVTCIANGKIYIGVTKQTLKQRWYKHCWDSKSISQNYFHNALRKYGADNFTVEEIFSGFTDRDIIEQHFIKENSSFENGYNSTLGGEDFTSSEYQRQLQKNRVAKKTHPFLGGKIQSSSSKKRFINGTLPIIGLNQKRIEEKTHNLLGENNPQKKRKRLNIKHHNQYFPWHNTNVDNESKKSWINADILYNWYLLNKNKKRGGSYSAMQKHFGYKCSLQKIYYKYFKNNWNPNKDENWLKWKNSVTNTHYLPPKNSTIPSDSPSSETTTS